MNIIVVRGGGIGDIVLTIPALYSLRTLHPDSRVTFMSTWNDNGESTPIPLLYGLDLIDDHIEVSYIGKLNLAILSQLTKIVFKERNRYQISVCLRHSLRSFPARILDYIVFKFLLNVKVGIGFWNSSDLSRASISHNDYYPMIKEYERLVSILCSEGLAINWCDGKKGIYEWVKNKLEHIPISFDNRKFKNAIVICPFSSLVEKRWDINNYIQLSKELLASSHKIVIIGGQNDRDLGNYICKEIGPSSHNLCGEFNIIELCRLFSISALYIGNDTGPMHLAGLMNTPCVAIFSRHNNPGKFSPMGEKNQIIRSKTDSINTVSYDEVLKSVNNVLCTN